MELKKQIIVCMLKAKWWSLPILVWFTAGCQTTSYFAKIDKEKRKIEVQSQSDAASPMSNLSRNGALNQTVNRLKEQLKSDPRNVTSLINLSQIYLSQNKLKDAEELCRQALKNDLKNQEAKLILAQIYYRRNNIDMADIIVNGLDENTSKDSQVINLKALIALKRDRPGLALALFQEALKNNPGDVAVRMNLGVLYVQYQQLDQAAVQFERVLSLMPDHPDAKLHLAIVSSSRKDFKIAEKYYDEVLGVDSNNPIATYNMAVLDERREEFDSAINHLRDYLDSSYAKSQNNQEVFSMIDRIRTQKELRGQSMSDSDIKDLASKASQPPVARTAPKLEEENDESQTVGQIPEATNPGSEAKRSEKPTPVKEKTNYRSDEEEIEALERALQ
ncbi:MAG: tetratricopeptide repeat protein [Oligoflexus sp.]